MSREVRGYLAHLAIERGLAANTLSSYRRDLVRYSTHLAGREALSVVTQDDVAEFLAALRTGDETHRALSARRQLEPS